MVSCEQHSMKGNFGKETSAEESVLQELEMVMAQVKTINSSFLSM